MVGRYKKIVHPIAAINFEVNWRMRGCKRRSRDFPLRKVVLRKSLREIFSNCFFVEKTGFRLSLHSDALGLRKTILITLRGT